MPKHQVERPHGSIKSYNLHIVCSGRGFVRTSNQTYELTKGMGFLFDREAAQVYGADPSDPWDIRWIHFDGKGIESLFENISLEGGWIFHCAKGDKLMNLIDDMLALCDPFIPSHEQQLSILLYDILLDLLLDAKPWNVTPHSNTKEERILLTADYIRLNCNRLISLNDMAQFAAYSPQHFSRTFHSIMGTTPIEYLTESRILASKRLLVSGRLSIKEIALKSGYQQSSYFIKQFHQLEGVTPQQYREIHSFA